MSRAVGHGMCHPCGRKLQLFITADGLRCEDCQSQEQNRAYQKPTYAPSFKHPWTEEFAIKREEAEAALPENHETVSMNDESLFQMDAVQSHALELHAGDIDEALSTIVDNTESYLEKEVEPGIENNEVVFGRSVHKNSMESYESHAELAPLVVFELLEREIHKVVFMCLSDNHALTTSHTN